ncbi:MAG: beta-ketoacyl-ACP synthase III [Ornithinimicrobium sp.]|uniref:beta-ketoacyl-ACP synthase III n=1 Tax=Ornithinimicrobium sp. TaxID=1977084 RepID=UPI0026E012D3|nr:beta-ketoacyl-ACP synthase III [Ornithinimicrobium sp.]MDO5739506.1 beta-ketoacyl-ACP synthase III [Ornithinimicrobium sp.]
MTVTGRKQITVSPGMRHARIHGLGGYRPERVVTNEEICQFIDSSDEWIQQRSGIVSRRRAAEDETVIDMAEAASRQALERAGISADQIGVVIMATVSHPFQTPAAAPGLAHRLGIPNPAAFDISAACAGYCHGISLANDMVRAGTADYVLVIGVEKLSDFTDKHDRGSAFIFGDGAGAAVVGVSDYPGIGPTLWGSMGEQAEAITQRESWTELRPQMEDTGRTDPIAWPSFVMQGQTVFRWAVFSMAPVAVQTVEAAGLTPDDLDAFVPHQANMRITDAMIKALKLPQHVPVARDIAETGNTSAASIPLAMSRMLDEGEAPHGGIALQIGFGAGLVYASQVVIMP